MPTRSGWSKTCWGSGARTPHGRLPSGMASIWRRWGEWRPPTANLLHHQLDDMAGGAELAVLPGTGDLAEHVLVDVAFGVPILHPDGVEFLDRFGEEGWGRDAEAGILHVLAESRAFSAKSPQKWE